MTNGSIAPLLPKITHGCPAVNQTLKRQLSRALRQKDEAMGVLFQRMREADVDYSDLIP